MSSPTSADLRTALERIAALESMLAESEQRALELQRQNDALVQLAVAAQLLGGATERDEVFDIIDEIVVNMIGSEHMAVLEVADDSGGELTVARARGIDVKTTSFLRARERAREALSERRTLLPADGELTAIVPLVIESTPLGAITIFRLLGHKRGLNAGDHALLDLLRQHAAQALLFTAAFRSMKPTMRPPAQIVPAFMTTPPSGTEPTIVPPSGTTAAIWPPASTKVTR